MIDDILGDGGVIGIPCSFSQLLEIIHSDSKIIDSQEYYSVPDLRCRKLGTPP